MQNKIIYQMKKGLNSSGGYTLLFSILITSLVVAIGVSILNIARKELILTGGAYQSQSAIYAADNGLECAVYWDGFGSFATSTDTNIGFIACEGHLVYSYLDYPSGSLEGTTTAHMIFDNKRCAQVEVVKKYVNGYLTTKISSRGYNVGANPYDIGDPYYGDCSKPEPNKVERALEYTY
jgi:hypothetical protein